MRKSLVSRYYQLLSGHAVIGFFLHERVGSTDVECWWCSSGGKAVPPPPLRPVHSLGPPDQKAMENGRERLWVKASKGPGGASAVGGEGG